MTNKQKWDIALQEYIHESDILEKARALFVYPYTKLSSVEKNEVTHEKLFCPYCFEKFNYKYRTNRRPYDEKIVCPNCKHEYGQNYFHSGTMYPTRIEFAGDYYSKDKLYYITAAKVNDKYGLVYVQLENGKYEPDEAHKRWITRFDVISYGFVNDECRFYFRCGIPTAKRITCAESYCTVVHFEESALECMNSWSFCKGKVNEQTAHYNLSLAEERPGSKRPPESSFSVKKAKQIMEEHPMRSADELPMQDYRFIRTRLVKRDNITNMNDYECECLSCGHKYQTSVHRQGGVSEKCPNCQKGGSVISEYTNYSSREALYVDMSADGKLAVRIIKHEFSFEDKITVKHTEKERIYLFPTSAEYQWTSIRNSDGYLRYLKNGSVEPGGYLNREITVMPEAQERLKYTGFKEYIDSALHDSASTSGIVRYLSVIFDHPALEKIIKVGWRELADDYVTEMLSSVESKMYSSNGALHEAIGIPKRLIKHLGDSTDNSPKRQELSELQQIVKLDENVMVDDLEYLKEHKIVPHMLAEIVGILGISIHQICEYLERVRISQCVPPYSAVTEWRDYLRAAKTIEADLSDKTVRYPSSLKREHDRAVFKQKIILDKDKEERFQAVCNEYGEKYAYEDDNYFITSPKCMQDLFEEGRRLNHCVGSYADSILGGTSCICFVRKKGHPTIPYFTVEILPYQDRICQVKGLSNRCVDSRRDIGLPQFLKTWAKKKKLLLEVI